MSEICDFAISDDEMFISFVTSDYGWYIWRVTDQPNNYYQVFEDRFSNYEPTYHPLSCEFEGTDIYIWACEFGPNLTHLFKYDFLGITEFKFDSADAVKGLLVCSDEKYVILVTKNKVYSLTINLEEIQSEEFEKDPLMQANQIYEIPSKCAQKDKKFITRYGQFNEPTEELAVWNNLFELQYKIKVEQSYRCIWFDESTFFFLLKQSEGCLYQITN